MKKSILSVLCFILVTFLFTGICSAYELPQKYSSDSYKTPIPDIEIPDEPEKQDRILTYYNGKMVDFSTKPRFLSGTVYVPMEEFFEFAGMSVDIDGEIKISGEGIEATFRRGSKKGTLNGSKISLRRRVRKIGGVVMCPACLISEVLDAKVWYDKDTETFVVSSGKYINDNILRVLNYKMWMNGEPFYEISFNKYDLFEEMESYFSQRGDYPEGEENLRNAEDALSILHENGFKTIRCFMRINARAEYFTNEDKKALYYTIVDKVFDLCEKYDISMNVCLEIPCIDAHRGSREFVAEGEDLFDLVCDRDSNSRKLLYRYLDEFISRYKDRRCILMWECANEGNLQCDIGWAVNSDKYSIYQLGQFYKDAAEKIRSIDPERVVTGGDGCFRSAQWHLYLGTKEGRIGADWTVDTLEDRLKAYVFLDGGLDVISGHCYSVGLTGIKFKKSEEDEETVDESFSLYMQEARRMGKVFYNGETAIDAEGFAEGFDERLYERSVAYLQDIVDAGVQLTHWWTFHCDCLYFTGKGYGWQVSDGPLFESIKKASSDLKEKYVKNGIYSENNDRLREAGIVGEAGCGSVINTGICSMVVICAAAGMTVKIGRKKRKNVQK